MYIVCREVYYVPRATTCSYSMNVLVNYIPSFLSTQVRKMRLLSRSLPTSTRQLPSTEISLSTSARRRMTSLLFARCSSFAYVPHSRTTCYLYALRFKYCLSDQMLIFITNVFRFFSFVSRSTSTSIVFWTNSQNISCSTCSSSLPHSTSHQRIASCLIWTWCQGGQRTSSLLISLSLLSRFALSSLWMAPALPTR